MRACVRHKHVGHTVKETTAEQTTTCMGSLMTTALICYASVCVGSDSFSPKYKTDFLVSRSSYTYIYIYIRFAGSLLYTRNIEKKNNEYVCINPREPPSTGALFFVFKPSANVQHKPNQVYPGY